MTNVMTTKLSSKGQVVLPEALRNEYGWDSGTSFTVLVYKGAVIMQPIVAPTESDLEKQFDAIFAESRRQSAAAGMKAADISRAISDVRSNRKARRNRN